MLNKKLIIGFIVALVALIVIGFAALNFVPTTDVLDLNLTDNTDDVVENVTEELNETVITEDLVNDTDVLNGTDVAIDDLNVTNASSDEIDPGDVLHKQTFTVTGNETGQYKGMEPGTYMIYYTENDGPIKIDKIG